MAGPGVGAIERVLFRSPRWAFLLGMAAVALVKSGLWFFPNTWVILPIVQDPFRDPFPPEYLGHYQMWTWLSPFLGHLLRTTSAASFTLLNLGLAAAFVAVVVGAAFRRLPDRTARIATIVFALLPVSWLTFYSLGPDSLTLLLLAGALVLAGRWWAVTACGVLLGFQHAEQAVVAAGAVILADLLDRRPGRVVSPIDWRFGAQLALGAIVGRLLLAGVFAASGVGSPAGRQQWIVDYADVLAAKAALGWPWLLWSVLGLGWLLAAYQVRLGTSVTALLVPLVLLACLTPLVFDQTRVMAIVTFPLVYRFWIGHRDFLERLGGFRAGWLAAVWAVVPTIYVLGAKPFGSVLPYTVAVLLHLVVAQPLPAGDLGMWPFS